LDIKTLEYSKLFLEHVHGHYHRALLLICNFRARELSRSIMDDLGRRQGYSQLEASFMADHPSDLVGILVF
jgi:hypothetical protein